MRAFPSGAGLLAALAAVAVAAAAAVSGGCATHASKIEGFRVAWGSGNYAEAEAAVDALIASESGAPVDLVQRTHALDDAVPAGKGNTYLLLLEKAMARLARGDAGNCVRVLLKARNELDVHLDNSLKGKFGDYLKAALSDDESMDYQGADYEHVLVRVMLAVTDLVTGGGDAYAFANQVGEIQDQIIDSPFGDEKNKYYPRRQYQRIAIGAYVQGVIQEANLDTSEAALAYKRGLDWVGGAKRGAEAGKEEEGGKGKEKGKAKKPSGPPPSADQIAATRHIAQAAESVLRASKERAESGQYAPEGHGVLHVFYLGGRGPHLEQTKQNPTSDAIQLAAVGATIATGSFAQLGQQPVPVPVVVATDWVVPPLTVSVDGGAPSASTATLLDVNLVAKQQLDANMPGIFARAVVRRTVKGAAGAAVEAQGGDYAKLLGFLTTAIATGVERAETRNWTSLPAQFQVARVPLAEGEHEVSFGVGMAARVKIARGRDTFVVVLRPNLALPGTVLVDRFSRVEETAPAPAPAPATSLPPVPKPQN
jgi:hypothetical protein